MHPSFVCVVVSTGMGSKTLHQQNPPVPNYVYFVDHYHRVWQCCDHPFTSCAALRAWALQGFMTLTFDLLTIELYRLNYQCALCELSTCISVLICKPPWHRSCIVCVYLPQPHAVNCVRFCFWHSLWLFCLCVKYLGYRWTDLRQIHIGDMFGPSLGRVWRSRSKPQRSRSPETTRTHQEMR